MFSAPTVFVIGAGPGMRSLIYSTHNADTRYAQSEFFRVWPWADVAADPADVR
jgi:hypothetical protein